MTDEIIESAETTSTSATTTEQQSNVHNSDANTTTESAIQKPEKQTDSQETEQNTDQKPDVLYDLKLPENPLISEEILDEIAGFAKKQGLSNEQAQELVTRENTAVQRYINTQISDFEKMSEQWKSDAQADKEIGGPNFVKNSEMASRAINEFGSEEFKDFLEKTGYGNHPEVIRFCSKIGKLISDDTFIRPGQNTSTEKTDEQILYGEKYAR